MNIDKRTRLIKQEAYRLGFSEIGISKAGFLDEEAKHLEQWLYKGDHGKMHYMENHFDKRLDPTKLVPDAKSVISLTYNYFIEKKQTDTKAPKISKYAYGKDYHYVIKDKLKALLFFIQSSIGDVYGRCFVDSAPVMERAWAKKSGVGWIGKNTLMLTKYKGSFFFLAELIIDLELTPDFPVKNYCGTCTKCIDACPTHAIYEPYKVDARKCISYLTIELKDELLPISMKAKMDNWMFGCDICQDVCPINARSQPHKEPAFLPKASLLNRTREEWRELTQEVFEQIFKHSPVQRTTFKGLKRNIDFLK